MEPYWRNSMTRLAWLWLTHDSVKKAQWIARAEEIREETKPLDELVDDPFDDDQAICEFVLSRNLELYFREILPDVDDLWFDAISIALDDVDWLALAEQLLKEAMNHDTLG